MLGPIHTFALMRGHPARGQHDICGHAGLAVPRRELQSKMAEPMLALVYHVICHQVLSAGIHPCLALGPHNEDWDPQTTSCGDPPGHGCPEEPVLLRTTAMCYPGGVDPYQGVAALEKSAKRKLARAKVELARAQRTDFEPMAAQNVLGLYKIANYKGQALFRALWGPINCPRGCGWTQSRITASSRAASIRAGGVQLSRGGGDTRGNHWLRMERSDRVPCGLLFPVLTISRNRKDQVAARCMLKLICFGSWRRLYFAVSGTANNHLIPDQVQNHSVFLQRAQPKKWGKVRIFNDWRGVLCESNGPICTCDC